MLTCRFLGAVTLAASLLFAQTALAEPPIWESDFGAALSPLIGTDDAETSVNLSFDFPFDSTTYTTVFVGTNGGLQLGSLGTTDGIFFDQWSHMEYFTADGSPSINGFVTDLDLSSAGTIHFNDFGDRAVFTWNAVPTVENELAVATFQISLYPSGRILMGWNGILDAQGVDLITDMAQGIVVGVSGGDIAQPTNPDPTDLTFVQTTGTTAFDRWCFDTEDSCGTGGTNLGLLGLVNTAFDLDQSNVDFVPIANGFNVNPGGATPGNLRVRCNDEVTNSSCGISYSTTDSVVQAVTEYRFRVESGAVGSGENDFSQSVGLFSGSITLNWSTTGGELRVGVSAGGEFTEGLVSGFQWVVDTDYLVEIATDTSTDAYSLTIDGETLIANVGFGGDAGELRGLFFGSSNEVIGAFQVDDIEITSFGAEGVVLRDTFVNGRLGAEPGAPDIGSLTKGTRGDRKIIVPEPSETALIATALFTLVVLRRKSVS